MSFQGVRTGKLIVFEGIDGTGKSTQIQLLATFLRDLGHEVVTSYEPTHGQFGSLLRQSATTGRLPLEEEIDLFLKDRQEHIDQLIAPALARGAYVLLDRYYISMMAYQSARGANPQEIQTRNEAFAPIPDAVIWLNIPVETALQRIGGRGEKDHFEAEDHLIHCKNIFSSIHEPWMLDVDATASPKEVFEQVVATLKDHQVI